MPRRTTRITVLLAEEDARLFEAHCQDRGFKKSTLIARLVREYLAQEVPARRPSARSVAAGPMGSSE